MISKEIRLAILKAGLNRLKAPRHGFNWSCDVFQDVIFSNTKLTLDQRDILVKEFLMWYRSRKPDHLQYQDFAERKEFIGRAGWWDFSSQGELQRRLFVETLIYELEHNRIK